MIALYEKGGKNPRMKIGYGRNRSSHVQHVKPERGLAFLTFEIASAAVLMNISF